MTEDTKKVIYSMVEVGKTYDGGKTVLRDISLSYFYGAKIGVIGLNGSGKSTLLRIMAGVEKDHLGETMLSEGFTVGYLEQEPQLEAGKTVREIVEEGVQEIVDKLKEFDEINEKFAEEMTDDEMQKLIERQGEVQETLDRLNAWDLDSRLELAMDALRCPPPETSVDVISGGERRRVALCRLLLRRPDILLLDEPTNHLDAETVAWLERHLQEYPGRSLRSRTIATSSTTSPGGFSSWTAATASRGRATTPPGSTRSRSVCARRRSRSRPGSERSSASSSGSA